MYSNRTVSLEICLLIENQNALATILNAGSDLSNVELIIPPLRESIDENL
jgi:hypothetical protein